MLSFCALVFVFGYHGVRLTFASETDSRLQGLGLLALGTLVMAAGLAYCRRPVIGSDAA
jgi:hypothetical protein